MLYRGTSKAIWCHKKFKTIDKRQKNLPPKIEVTNEDKVRVWFNEPWIEMI